MLIRHDNRRIRYDLIGPEDAPVVCLLHCLTSDSGVWAEQAPALLAYGWRVLTIDMRGHGGSEAGQGPFAMAGLANDVAAVLDFLGLERVHLVGLSIGGMIAQQFALDHGHRLHSLMLTGTSAQAVPGPPDMWPKRFALVGAAGDLDPVADDAMARWVTEAYPRNARWRQVRETIVRTSLAGYIEGAKAIIAFDIRERLPFVSTPTLVICGDDDPGTPAEGNRLIASLIPGARYEEIARARHLPMVEHPGKFAKIMLDWLESRG